MVFGRKTAPILRVTFLAGVEDFVAVNSTLTFAPSPAPAQQCVNINITDDARLENTESFLLVISSSDPDIIIVGNSIVVITDNDSEINTIIIEFSKGHNYCSVPHTQM